MRLSLLSAATALLALPIMGCAGMGTGSHPTQQTAELEASGWRKLELHDDQAALVAFDAALDASPSAKLHAGRGRARSAFEDAIALEPNAAEWRVGLAVVECARGDLAAAVRTCNVAIDCDPRAFKAYYNRGSALLEAGDVDPGLADLTLALRLNPDFAEAHNSLGVGLARQGRLDAAIGSFVRASSLVALPAAHANCAAAYYAKGETQLALTELNTAIRLDRSSPTHLANRGRIYLDLREPELAAADFEAAYVLFPTAPGIAGLLAEARQSAARASKPLDAAPRSTPTPASYRD